MDTILAKAAEEALTEITGDISGRSGLGDALDQIDDDIRNEMKATHLEIILRQLEPINKEVTTIRAENERLKAGLVEATTRWDKNAEAMKSVVDEHRDRGSRDADDLLLHRDVYRTVSREIKELLIPA